MFPIIRFVKTGYTCDYKITRLWVVKGVLAAEITQNIKENCTQSDQIQ